MRRTFVAQSKASAISLPFCLALHQHRHAAGQTVDICGLPGNDIRQVVDRAGQMRDALFQ